MIKILLQTTIESSPDDWDIERFSLLRDHLAGAKDEHGRPLFNVTARNRGPIGATDPVLSNLVDSDFDEVWLFAVDSGDGLTEDDCIALSSFRRRGGGLLVTRDHMDLGCSVCDLAGVGAAHHFHTHNKDPDKDRWCIDDPYTTNILWPNYHSGANGDYQSVRVVGEPHVVLRKPASSAGLLRYLPSHPHEGAVSAPADDASARVILQGRSTVTGVTFNLAVAFEPSAAAGPAIAQSTFHHFADYNWDVASGAPSFVSEQPGDGIRNFPEALRDTQQYVVNVALWLGGRLGEVREIPLTKRAVPT